MNFYNQNLIFAKKALIFFKDEKKYNLGIVVKIKILYNEDNRKRVSV